jgi:hypothetical protein
MTKQKGQASALSFWDETYEALYRNLAKSEGEAAARRWKATLVNRSALADEAKLREVFRLINSPLPDSEEERHQTMAAWVTMYTYFSPVKIDHPVVEEGTVIGIVRSPTSPPAPTHDETWVPTIWRKTRHFIEAFYDAVVHHERALTLPAVDHAEGTRYSLVKDGRVVHRYLTADATSAFLLTLGDLLSNVDDLTRMRRCSCGNFFLRKGKQNYCSPACTQKAHPATTRVYDHRDRVERWEKKKRTLELRLADMTAIEKKRRLERPRSARQVVEEAETALADAKKAFSDAYRRPASLSDEKKRQYAEGNQLLSQSIRHIKQLRKKVKGY